MKNIQALFKALEAKVKRGWKVLGIARDSSPSIQFINTKGNLVTYPFIPIDGGIRFTKGPLKDADIIVNENED